MLQAFKCMIRPMPMHGGVFNYRLASFMEKLQKRQRNKQGDEFKKEIVFMASKNSFSLVDYRQRVLDGLDKLQKGITQKFFSGNEQTEASLVLQRKILNAMHEDELVNPDLLDADKKKEIALVAQCSPGDLNSMLKQYMNLKDIHTWLRNKKENNEQIPDTQEELMWLFKKERPVSKSFKRKHMKAPSFSKKMRKQAQKWGYMAVIKNVEGA